MVDSVGRAPANLALGFMLAGARDPDTRGGVAGVDGMAASACDGVLVHFADVSACSFAQARGDQSPLSRVVRWR